MRAAQYQDPFSPLAAMKRPTNLLPVDRLRRLGATERTVTALQRLWAATSDEGRRDALKALALASDSQLTEGLATLDDLHEASAASIEQWVDSDPGKARLAICIEEARGEGNMRTGMLKRIARVAAQDDSR